MVNHDPDVFRHFDGGFGHINTSTQAQLQRRKFSRYPLLNDETTTEERDANMRNGKRVNRMRIGAKYIMNERMPTSVRGAGGGQWRTYSCDAR
jgi:hypothetical protein